MMRRFSALLTALLCLLTVLPMAEASAQDVITSVEQLNRAGISLGTELGCAADLTIREKLPEAKLEFYNDKLLGYTDVANGKLDAFIYDRRQMELAIKAGLQGVRLLDTALGEPVRIAAGISPVSTVPDLENRLNEFIAGLRADGTLDDMFMRWVINGDESMPAIELPKDPDFHLTVGTSGVVPPYSYYVGTELNGYDIELAYRFALWLGADLQLKVYDYGAIVSAAVSGDVDCIMANLNITAERAEVLTFSDILYEEQMGVMVKGEGPVSSENSAPAPMGGKLEETATPSKDVRWQDYNGKRLGVLIGPVMEDVAKEFFPDSEYLFFNSYPDCIAALLSGKIDAYLGDEPELKSAHAEQPEIDYIHERLTQNNYSFAFRKNDPKSAELCEELNAFLAACRVNGSIQELEDIWFGTDESRKVVDMTGLTGENGTIRVVTTSTDMPYSYIKDGKNVGYDIDLVTRFCREKGYALELGDVDVAARIPAVQSGKYDFTTDMNVTPEREEQVLFSDPTSYGGIVLAVLSHDFEVGAPGRESINALNGERAGVITGSFHDVVIAEELPNSVISQYNNYTDMIVALKTNKIDYFLASTEVAGSLIKAEDTLVSLAEPIRILDIGAMFARTEKGKALQSQMNEYIEKIRADGTLDEIYRFWSDPVNESVPVDMSGLTDVNGKLKFATSGTKVPISFVVDGQIAGTDPDIAVRFCREYGYAIEVNVVDTASIIPGIVTEMYDFSLSDMVITDERKESVNFSVPYHETELLIVTRKAETEAAKKTEPVKTGILELLEASFNKTFIRENRWQLFVNGVFTTLLITLLTILFGTALGFTVFMLCRTGNPIANLITRFCLWLVQGMPMVVLLMILYYLVFASVAISGIAVAVIGFTLTFGAAVYGLLKMGVGAVDNGQYEAAYALGYSRHRTFFKIILPQALPHVLPAYRGEIVGLIKATAVVGYIAVQDLTKMGDIVRSRTYEAFFPLIAVTVIYFLLEGLIGFIVSRVVIVFNPRRRKPAGILKGVRTDD